MTFCEPLRPAFICLHHGEFVPSHAHHPDKSALLLLSGLHMILMTMLIMMLGGQIAGAKLHIYIS